MIDLDEVMTELAALAKVTADACSMPEIPKKQIRTWDEIRVDSILRKMHNEEA